MKKFSGLILLFYFLFSTAYMYSQESFYVYFKQNGKRINVKKSKIELKKSPFEIYAEYTAPLDLFVSASFNNDTWQKASRGKLLSEIPVFKDRNKKLPSFFDFDKTLVLSPNTAFLWKKNMSDTVPLLKNTKGRSYNVKKVKSLFVSEKTQAVLPENFEEPVFLVFIYTVKDKDGEEMEIQRETIKISWVDKFKEETKAYEKRKKREAKDKIRIAKQSLKAKQKAEKKEKKRLERLEKEKQKRLEKEKKRKEKQDKEK